MAVDHNNPQSRNEEILIATIDGKEYNKNPQSRMEELLLELKEAIEEGGGGGTSDYENLSNQPQVNGEILIGDKSGADLGLVDAEEGKGLSTNDYDDTEKAAVAAATSAISAMKDGTDLDSFGDVEVALLDKADISDLGTAAAKDSTNTVTSGSTDLVESGAVKDAIDSAVSRTYHHAGTKTVAQLTHDLLIAANEGNVYEITDSGTTTSDFMEGIGRPIKEGDNVGVARVSEGVYKFDLLSGFVDTTNFVQKSVTAGLLKNDGTVDTTIQGDVSTLKSGFTNLDNEVNGDATVYPYADVITIEDAVPSNLADCTVKIEPVQNLHGYDHPWVGGAGKNKVHAKNYTSDSYDGTTYTDVAGDQYIADDITLPSGTYTYSVKLLSLPSADRSFSVYKSKDTSSAYFNITHLENATVGQVYSGTFTLAEETTIVTRLWGYGGGEFKIQMQLESGETATSFAPYTNICPISGHTEASVQRDGKNKFAGIENGSYNTTATKTPSNDRVRSNSIFVLKQGTYTLSATINIEGKTPRVLVQTWENDTYGTNTKLSDSGWKNNNYTFTLENDSYVTCLFSTSDDANVTYENFRAQLELGSTATPYVPYAGKTYTIALGDTIYGGTVDFDSGVMTVTHALVDLGTKSWTYAPMSGGRQRFQTTITGLRPSRNADDVLPAICSQYKAVSYNSSWLNGNMSYSEQVDSDNISIIDNRYDNTSDFTTAMDGVQLCYELATPTTIQLTPQQIQLLKGQNTLTASTGDISVTVNGVSGSIGAVQEQVNDTDAALAELAAEIADKLPTAPTTDGAYVLTVTVADGTPTYSWESAT